MHLATSVYLFYYARRSNRHKLKDCIVRLVMHTVMLKFLSPLIEQLNQLHILHARIAQCHVVNGTLLRGQLMPVSQVFGTDLHQCPLKMADSSATVTITTSTCKLLDGRGLGGRGAKAGSVLHWAKTFSVSCGAVLSPALRHENCHDCHDRRRAT